MTSGIYIIQNTVNGKRYVGSAVNLPRRESSHRSLLRRGKHHSPHLQASFAKHGEAAFKFWIAEECSKEQLIEREQWWLDMFEPEYNILQKAGSARGYKHSTEARAKISAAAKGHKRNLGQKHSPERIAKRAAAVIGNKHNLGRKASAQTRAKMSAALKGNSRGLGVPKRRS